MWNIKLPNSPFMTKILHAYTKKLNIFLSSSLSRFQVIGMVYIKIKFFHWSAVKPEKLLPIAILLGILSISDSNFILFARSCIVVKFFAVNCPSSIHSRVTIHFAMPKNKQYMGLIMRNCTGLKYENWIISDHRTSVSDTYFLQTSSVLHFFYKNTLFRILLTFLDSNHCSISSNLPKLEWFLFAKSATFLHLW